MVDGNKNPVLTAEAAAQLQEGINLVLSRWAALRMAIENEWGGRDSAQKSQQLAQILFHSLTQSKEKVYIDDLEDVLDEFMLSLNTEIGDGSIEEIAEKLMVMHEECVEGNFSSINRLKETNTPSVSYVRQVTITL
ncbi:Pre-rRNA-proCES [Forsythia ovata]|uniref:Pre-rRNA-proCES n=1 Tax=Forsythia ovata TaxID=205694 RepID=A0ABD1W827_9LAMI